MLISSSSNWSGMYVYIPLINGWSGWSTSTLLLNLSNGFTVVIQKLDCICLG